jgi:hypothetical protein
MKKKEDSLKSSKNREIRPTRSSSKINIVSGNLEKADSTDAIRSNSSSPARSKKTSNQQPLANEQTSKHEHRNDATAKKRNQMIVDESEEVDIMNTNFSEEETTHLNLKQENKVAPKIERKSQNSRKQKNKQFVDDSNKQLETNNLKASSSKQFESKQSVHAQPEPQPEQQPEQTIKPPQLAPLNNAEEASQSRKVEFTHFGKSFFIDVYEHLQFVRNNKNGPDNLDNNASKNILKSINEVNTATLASLPKVNIDIMENYPICYSNYKLPKNYIKQELELNLIFLNFFS